MNLLQVGKVVNTFGIKGELKILSDSDFIEDRFKVGNKLIINDNEEVTITSFRMHKGNVLIRFNDLNDINEVEKYKNKDLFVNRDSLKPLDDGYYLFQLEDLAVYEDNKEIGKVIEVLKPAQTVLRIKLADREIMIPFVDAFIESVDLDNKRINVTMIEGF